MKKRLDVLVLENGFETSRERAKAMIMAGLIYVENQRAEKPGEFFSDDVRLECRGLPLQYVSRGGLKLEKALEAFEIDLSDRICMDIGCSTGGFSDCALQNGAKEILAIDVGYGQFDWQLRNDFRIHLLEKTNARYLKAKDLNGLDINFVMADVSFISLLKIVVPIKQLVNPNCEFVCLIKPQFEATKKEAGKGIIKDEKLRIEIVKRVLCLIRESGFLITGVIASPIEGVKGNVEYLVHFEQNGSEGSISVFSRGVVLEPVFSDVI
ncbi:MAG: TlyA family RNA methyltransferase [Oscillospiraceae bacterium]|jgi:23S rRNA (cytidine1920-2'-O)/16S rRNA (cytidine1409-2'-O)-methyltransferase|nr:TlyA family RNA methyltransferase [Oscillospiraceae bacterium]